MGRAAVAGQMRTRQGGGGGGGSQSLATRINWTTPPVWRSSPSPRCWSTVGRNGGQQLLSLSVYGCMDRGIIQHELLHALGFHHEHNRSDRDEHVRINWENVPEGELLLRVDRSKVSPGRPSWEAPTRGFFSCCCCCCPWCWETDPVPPSGSLLPDISGQEGKASTGWS